MLQTLCPYDSGAYTGAGDGIAKQEAVAILARLTEFIKPRLIIQLIIVGEIPLQNPSNDDANSLFGSFTDRVLRRADKACLLYTSRCV